MADVSVLLALGALLIYGLTQVISKYVVQSLNATSTVAINFLVSVPIYLVFLVGTVLTVGFSELPVLYLFFGLVGASTARVGYYLFLEALEKGSVTMVGSITAAYPAITAILAVTVLGESLSPVNAAGVAIIIASMVALSYSHGRTTGVSGFPRSALLLSMATLMLWGFGAIFIKLALTEIPLIAYLGLYPFILPPLAFVYLRHKRATKEVFFPKWTVPVILAIVIAELWQLGYFAETAAISVGAAAIVFPLISAYPVVTIVGAHIFLKESLSRTDWVLLICVVLGIILTTISQS